jgi:hypothetical protein
MKSLSFSLDRGPGDEGTRCTHIVALCCIAVAVVLLMAPASIHRIAFAGQDDPAFLRMGSVFVVSAPLPLAFGIALDTYVAAGRALQSEAIALALAAAAIIVLLGVWYALPLWRRVHARAIFRHWRPVP